MPHPTLPLRPIHPPTPPAKRRLILPKGKRPPWLTAKRRPKSLTAHPPDGENGQPGVFSYGSGTTVNVSDSTITTTADAQTLDGNILVNTISSLNLTLKNSSTFTGTVNIAENTGGGTAVSENAIITIESGCTWTLTGDCTITSLTNNGTINFNGHTITLADGTVLR